MVQNKSEANFYVRSFLFLLGHYVSSHLCFAKSSSTPWHLDRLDQRNGIDFSPFNGEVVARTRPVLYVIDSGIEQDHKEFTSGLSAVIDGYNFVNESWECGDCMGHGTHVAGLAAGHEYGVAGSIGADIVSVRVLDCHGRGSCSSLIRALEWYVGLSTKLCAFGKGVGLYSCFGRPRTYTDRLIVKAGCIETIL